VKGRMGALLNDNPGANDHHNTARPSPDRFAAQASL
jgi:hypothetical protein